MRDLQMFNYDRMISIIEGYFKAQKYWPGLNAISYARTKHGDTTRKSSNLKFFCHPILVAYLTTLLNLEPEITTIALLHDVSEDAHADFSTLPGGPRVQAGVKALTLMKIRPDESKNDQKLRYYGQMDGNIDALIIKMLDRFTNLTSMVGALSKESIEQNILETFEKLLPAVKRSRRAKTEAFRKKRDVLFVLQITLRAINEPLAHLCSVEKVKEKFHDLARTHARLEGRLEVRDESGEFLYNQADMALTAVRECYTGGDSTSLDNENLARNTKVLRAMLLAAFTIAFGIREDNAIATVLLSDLNHEIDCSVFNKHILKALRRLNPIPLYLEEEQATLKRSYAELAQVKEALLAKALYRWVEICYGHTSSGKVFNHAQMKKLILETDAYLIKALEIGREKFGEFSSIFEFMIINLRLSYESIAKFKNINLPKIDGFYEGKIVSRKSSDKKISLSHSDL